MGFSMKAFYVKNIFYPSLLRLGSELLPPKMRMTVTRAIRKTSKFVDDLDQIHSENLSRCARHDSDGNIIFKDTKTHEVEIDNDVEWKKALDEMNDIEFILDEYVLESDFPDTPFRSTDSNTLACLKDFIRQSDEDCCVKEECNKECESRKRHKGK